MRDGEKKTKNLLIAGSVLLLIAGIVLRVYRLTTLPLGLHQDEASIGYESYLLARFGIDRNGLPFPVYPITYGSGGGSPLLIYLNVIATKLFGPGVATVRGTTAFFGCLTIGIAALTGYRFEKDVSKRERLLLMFCMTLVLSLSPWHIMLSRWSLDCNTTPFWILCAVCCMASAVNGRKPQLLYPLAALFYALTLYSYGSANIVVPLHLLLMIPYLYKRKYIAWKDIFVSGAVFVITLLPLMLFYAVNYFGLPEIVTGSFSVSRFTASRFSHVFVPFDETLPQTLLQNLLVLLKALTIGYDDGLIYNTCPVYLQFYPFTFPFIWIGIICSARRLIKSKDENTDIASVIPLTLLIAASVLTLVIRPEVSRMTLLFPGLAVFLGVGLKEVITTAPRLVGWIPVAAILTVSVFFIHHYFSVYEKEAAYAFMPGFGDCVTVAEAAWQERGDEDARICTTYENVASPFMIALYYTLTDPEDFIETVHYRDDTAEFRVATSFTHYVFGLPDDLRPDDICIIGNWQRDAFDNDSYELTTCGNFTVAVPVR